MKRAVASELLLPQAIAMSSNNAGDSRLKANIVIRFFSNRTASQSIFLAAAVNAFRMVGGHSFTNVSIISFLQTV